MSDVLNGFINKKKADAPFVSLKAGESIRVTKVVAIKTVLKQGFNGDETEVLRLVCEVETTEGQKTKNFDNGTKRFAEMLVDNKISLGSAFTITREGEKTSTRYVISDVQNTL